MKKQTITIKDIAEECGVSVATVSRVMNNVPGKYSIETEKKIQSVAEKLGYIPNVMARSLVTQKTGLVAVLIPDIHYYFYQELYTGIESYFNKYNIRPILCSTLESKEREHEYIKSMSNGLADGIIIATLNKNEDNDLLLSLNNEKYPIVSVERYGQSLDGCCNVRGNNYLSGEKAVDYLHAKGHKKIAFIGGSKDAQNSELRLAGYLYGMKKNNLVVDYDLIVNSDYKFEENVNHIMHMIMNKEFTAIIAANDLICVGVANILKSLKKKVPAEISLIGLDNTAYMKLNHPSLTAISFKGVDLGTCAAQCIVKMIEGKKLTNKEYVIDPILNIGKSVKSLL